MNNKKMLLTALIALFCGSSVMNGMYTKYISEGLYKKMNITEVMQNSHVEAIKYLIDKGISSDHLLVLACYYESVEIVKFLLEEGVNPNAKDENGNTALHCAIKQNSKNLNNNQEALVKLLLEYGANPLVDNKQNESVLEDSSLPNKTKQGIGLFAEKNFTIKSKF